MSNFKNLLVWRRAHDLASTAERIAIRIAPHKPRLADQVERAAAAIPAMIAEGSGLGTDKSFANLVSRAIGEASELENHAQRGFDSRVLSSGEYDELTAGAIEVRRMLIGLRKRLRGEKQETRV